MKKKFLELEFLKGDLISLENQILEIEKSYFEADPFIREAKSYIRKLQNVPLLEYRKIQIHYLINTLKKMEKNHKQGKKQLQLIYRQIEKLKDIEIMDSFSKSVETHVIKTLKKKYTLKPKYSKEGIYFYIFKYKHTFYCIHGKLESVLFFSNKEDLIHYLEPLKKDSIIFPDYKNIQFFIPDGITKFKIAKIIQKDTNRIYYMIFYNKILCKDKIENLTLYELKDQEIFFIKFYFLYKGKKIYMLE